MNSPLDQEKQRIARGFAGVAWNESHTYKEKEDFMYECLNRFHSAVVREVGGMKKDEENFEVPQGENIGEYRFTQKLRREGYNKAINDVISVLSPNKDKEE